MLYLSLLNQHAIFNCKFLIKNNQNCEDDMEVSPLERVQAVFRREEPPDRVPIFELMIDPNTVNGILPGGSYEDLVEALDIDCVVSPTPSSMFGKEIIGYNGDFPIFKTEWGETREDNAECVAIPIDHPIKNHADWERYQIPDPEKPGRLDALKELVKKYGHTDEDEWVDPTINQIISAIQEIPGAADLFQQSLQQAQEMAEGMESEVKGGAV